MKADKMQGDPAIVVQEHHLKAMLIEAGKIAAKEVVAALRADLNQDPIEKCVLQLRAYISDRATLSNPREQWASYRHIVLVAPSLKNKPKSYSWFQKFKKESRLNKCGSRTAAEHGRLVEWCFEDIANAWDVYHHQRWMG